MARVQSRRTISFNVTLIDRIKEEAKRAGQTAAHWIADAAIEKMARAGRPFTKALNHVDPSEVQNPKGKNGRGANGRLGGGRSRGGWRGTSLTNS